jgi:hypothetical protein
MSNKTMRIQSLSSVDIDECHVEVEIQIISTKKIYCYRTLKRDSEIFSKKYRASFGGWSSLNYLKNNSKMVTRV